MYISFCISVDDRAKNTGSQNRFAWVIQVISFGTIGVGVQNATKVFAGALFLAAVRLKSALKLIS